MVHYNTVVASHWRNRIACGNYPNPTSVGFIFLKGEYMLLTMTLDDLNWIRELEARHFEIYKTMEFINNFRIDDNEIIYAKLEETQYHENMWNDRADPIYKKIIELSIIPVYLDLYRYRTLYRVIREECQTFIDFPKYSFRLIITGISKPPWIMQELRGIYQDTKNPTRFNISKKVLYSII